MLVKKSLTPQDSGFGFLIPPGIFSFLQMKSSYNYIKNSWSKLSAAFASAYLIFTRPSLSFSSFICQPVVRFSRHSISFFCHFKKNIDQFPRFTFSSAVIDAAMRTKAVVCGVAAPATRGAAGVSALWIAAIIDVVTSPISTNWQLWGKRNSWESLSTTTLSMSGLRLI